MTARHWTEDELLAHLYGIGPEDGHVSFCKECAERLRLMEESRLFHEASSASVLEPGFDFLTGQRRRIYQRISNPARHSMIWRLAPAVAASLVLALGLLLFNQQHARNAKLASRPTDAQLVDYVGGAATDPEPAPVAPIQALFQE